MKRLIFLLGILVLALLLFVGKVWFLSEDKEYEFLEFTYGNGTVPPSYQVEGTLTVSPDYVERTLDVEYQLVYPLRDNETPEEDYAADGTVGGEFFERFEEVGRVLEKDVSMWIEGMKICVGGGSLQVDVYYVVGEDLRQISLAFCGELDGDVGLIRDFYVDVVDLLELNVY